MGVQGGIDLLNRIKHGYLKNKIFIYCPSTKYNKNILNVLYQEGFIGGYSQLENIFLRIFLKYTFKGYPAIREISIISKPGKFTYLSSKILQKKKNNIGCIVVSTPYGILTDKMCNSLNIGGKVICIIF